MESLSDIVAQMRGRGEDGRMDRHLWNEYADRIEAAAKRVVVSKTETTTVGNSAAMREALVKVRFYLPYFLQYMRLRWEDAEAGGYYERILEVVNAALSAPARNCDLQLVVDGPADNNADKAWLVFKRHNPEAYFDVSGLLRCIDWLLAPAAEEGAGK